LRFSLEAIGSENVVAFVFVLDLMGAGVMMVLERFFATWSS